VEQISRNIDHFSARDAVRIQVWDLYEERSTLNLSNDYPIDPQGNVIMPILERLRSRPDCLRTEKNTRRQAQGYLRNPLVAVQPLIRITLHGAFIRPGAYRVPPSVSLWRPSRCRRSRGDCDLKRMAIERAGRRSSPICSTVSKRVIPRRHRSGIRGSNRRAIERFLEPEHIHGFCEPAHFARAALPEADRRR